MLAALDPVERARSGAAIYALKKYKEPIECDSPVAARGLCASLGLGAFLSPSPLAEQVSARKDRARKASAGDRAGSAGWFP